MQEESFSLQNKSNIKLKAKVTSARKSRSQASKEEEGCLISGAKAPASKALKVLKNPPEVMARANPELSNKEKVVLTSRRNLKILHFVKLFFLTVFFLREMQNLLATWSS